ncbi:MAG: hypothetical protein RBU37_09345, partial [Myxococcota bacterium]|nr:hypothetical protein [Myxococcota bacterium]
MHPFQSSVAQARWMPSLLVGFLFLGLIACSDSGGNTQADVIDQSEEQPPPVDLLDDGDDGHDTDSIAPDQEDIPPDDLLPDEELESIEEIEDDADEETVQPSGVIGAPCEESAECLGNICSTLLPHGYCTSVCLDGVCPEGARCATINDYPFCMKACNSKSDCRSGYSCLNGVCDIQCRNVFDCDSGEQCVDGVCEEPVVELKQVNQACSSGQECVTGYCLSAGDGGVCTEPCPCSVPGWLCRPIIPTGGSQALNLCGPGGSFIADVIELSYPYEFYVGADVRSFMIVADLPMDGKYAWIDQLKKPDGSFASGELDYETGFTAPYRVTVSDSGHASAIVPQNEAPALQVQPGTWSFSLHALEQIEPPRVRVFFKRRFDSGAVTQATFDLNFFLAPGAVSGVNANNAAQSSFLSNVVNRMRNQFFNTHGISLGSIRYYDMPSAYSLINGSEELHQMQRQQSIKAPEGGLNVFLVSNINLDGGYSTDA